MDCDEIWSCWLKIYHRGEEERNHHIQNKRFVGLCLIRRTIK